MVDEETKKPESGKSPYFVTELQTETIWEEENEEIVKRLVVKVKGTPKPTVRWYENGVEIVPSEELEIEECDEGVWMLTVKRRSTETVREITCEAVNEHGTAITKTMMIPSMQLRNHIFVFYDYDVVDDPKISFMFYFVFQFRTTVFIYVDSLFLSFFFKLVYLHTHTSHTFIRARNFNPI